MKAYQNSDLLNKALHEQASEAFHTGCIDEATYRNILLSHPVKLYTPNYFIRIALAVLTLVAILFSAALLTLITGFGNGVAAIVVCLIMAFACYFSLELFVKNKRYYNAGIDNMLMIAVVSFLLGTFFIEDLNHQDIIASAMATVFFLWMCIHYTDAFMAMLAFVSLFTCLFFVCMLAGPAAILYMPFIMAAFSAIVYFFVQRIARRKHAFFYVFCCDAVRLVCLLGFYASLNYFVVKEVGGSLLTGGAAIAALPMGWLFWLFTAAIPPAYILWGIKTKDLLLIRTGLFLLAIAVFTVRYYYSAMPVEGWMLIAGLSLVATSYALIKLLRTPRLGFTFEKSYESNDNLLNLEALIIAQTSGKIAAPDTGFQFGGGSGGGGGATGNF